MGGVMEGDGWRRRRGTDDIVCLMFIFPYNPDALCTSPLMRGGRIFISGVPEDMPVGKSTP